MNNLYTNEEFKELCVFASSIRDWIPEDKAGYVWNNYKKISGDNSNAPCTCGSAAPHWKRAMDTIRTYIKENSDKYANGSNG